MKKSSQQIETNNFFVAGIGELTGQELKSAIWYQQVKSTIRIHR